LLISAVTWGRGENLLQVEVVLYEALLSKSPVPEQHYQLVVVYIKTTRESTISVVTRDSIREAITLYLSFHLEKSYVDPKTKGH
jgi:hypothetical protein